jgi:HD superfamily phosphodiesterase
VKKYEIDFCDEKMDKLNTDTAKELLKEKKDFIRLFISQLENELDGTDINELGLLL